MNLRLRFIPLAALAVVVLSAVAPAGRGQTVLHVRASAPGPGSGTLADPFTSIQSAIVAAVAGDTVLVQPGTYVENIDFLGKAITLESTSGSAVTIIDGGAGARCATFISGEGATSVLRGFTLRNGTQANGGGVVCDFGSDPTIEDCVIRDNVVCIGGGGVGIFGSSPTFRRCAIVDNISMVGGGGLAIDQSSAVFVGCRIVNNVAQTAAGGAMTMSFSNVVFRGCEISDNTAVGFGGAMDLFNATPVLEDCLLDGNSGLEGGAIYCFTSSPVLRRCRLLGNQAATDGGAILSHSGTPTLEECALLFNDAGRGGAIWDVVASTTLTGCTVAANTAGLAGGVGFFSSTAPAFTNSIFWANVPDQIAPFAGALTVAFCDVQGGHAGAGNIDADPLFADLPNADVRLMPGSPCLEAGDNASTSSVTDFEGHPRIVGATVDIGLDELVPSFPGSGEDLLLRTLVNGAGGEVDTNPAAAGDVIRVEMSTPGGTFALRPPLLVGQVYATGSPPVSPPGFPEVKVGFPGAALVFDGASVPFPFGPVVLDVAPVVLQSGAPAGLAGLVVRFQLLVLATFASNGIFATSDACDLVF